MNITRATTPTIETAKQNRKAVAEFVTSQFYDKGWLCLTSAEGFILDISAEGSTISNEALLHLWQAATSF